MSEEAVAWPGVAQSHAWAGGPGYWETRAQRLHESTHPSAHIHTQTHAYTQRHRQAHKCTCIDRLFELITRVYTHRQTYMLAAHTHTHTHRGVSRRMDLFPHTGRVELHQH